jgi:plastocyanin
MSASPSVVERTGGERRSENAYPPARRRRTRVQIVSKPFSLRAFALAGAGLFAAAFVCGRYLGQLDAAAAGGSAPPVATAPAVTPVPTPAAQASTATAEQPSAPKVTTVTVRLMKFSPEQIEIKAGDTVEWKNADLTPHTATAPTKEFDSGPINPNASWRQTFAKTGSFPYVCTFHPEMHGLVVVK